MRTVVAGGDCHDRTSILSSGTGPAEPRAQAQAAGIAFKAILADCFYGDNNALEGAFRQRCLPYVLAHRGTIWRVWAPADIAHSLEDAARDLPLRAWQRIARRFRDGHTQQWWAVELTLFGYGADKPVQGDLRHHRPPYLARSVDLVFDDQPACSTGAPGGSRAPR